MTVHTLGFASVKALSLNFLLWLFIRWVLTKQLRPMQKQTVFSRNYTMNAVLEKPSNKIKKTTILI